MTRQGSCLVEKIDEAEKKRLHVLTLYERKARKSGYSCIAGVDEAGRGPLAGPVVAAACIIPGNRKIAEVNDSKKLTPIKRGELFRLLTSDASISYGVGVVDNLTIDKINILQATILAMLQAIDVLAVTPDLLLVDGMSLAHPSIPSQGIINGDALSQSIAAASIIAKETRDRLMEEYHEKWPEYGFNKHKGYGTKEHLKAIQCHGPCPIHRFTFEPIKSSSQKSEVSS